VTIAATLPALPRLRLSADALLKASAAFWLAVALIGQWLFFAYIAAFYGPSTLSGNFQEWAKNGMLFKGFQPGDTVGNLTFGTHALAAGIIAFGGALQLLPQVRARFPRFHRWNGRVFLLTALTLSVGGLYLVWVRGTGQSLTHNLAITGNAAAILGCAALSWRTAVTRKLAAHRRWAMRLYLVSNAQWFTRVGFFAFAMITMGLGVKGLMDEFFLIWSFGCYLVPLAVLELYFRAKDSGRPAAKLAMAGGLGVLTLLMMVGAGGFSFLMMRLVAGYPLALPG
jgi:hypothetical protein